MNRLWLAGAGSALIHLLLVVGISSSAQPSAPPPVLQSPTAISIVTLGHAPATSPSGAAAPLGPKARSLRRRVSAAPVLDPAASESEEPSDGDVSAPSAGEVSLQGTEVSAGEPASDRSVAQPPDSATQVYARLAAVADGCYPAAARRFQQRGTVQLSFCVTDEGRVSAAKVVASSGAELLDKAAQDCVLNRAQPFPLSASGQCFALPTRFGRSPQ